MLGLPSQRSLAQSQHCRPARMLRRALQRASDLQGAARVHRGFAAAAAQPATSPAPSQASSSAVKTPEPDWAAIEAVVVSAEGRREVASLRAVHNEATRYLEEQDKEPVEIDWAKYKEELDPRLYEAFHKAWQDFKAPTFDAGPLLKKVKDEFAPLLAEAKEMVQHSQQRTKELDAEIAALDQQMARLEKVTIDEAMAENPKIAEEVDKEISAGRWY